MVTSNYRTPDFPDDFFQLYVLHNEVPSSKQAKDAFSYIKDSYFVEFVPPGRLDAKAMTALQKDFIHSPVTISHDGLHKQPASGYL